MTDDGTDVLFNEIYFEKPTVAFIIFTLLEFKGHKTMFSTEFERTNHIALIVSPDDPSVCYVGLKGIQKSYIPKIMLDFLHNQPIRIHGAVKCVPK